MVSLPGRNAPRTPGAGPRTFRVDEVSEVPVAGPFLDLDVRQAGQPFALAVGG